MKAFLDENFLLQNDTAQILYHEYASKMPIIDYHNHLPPDEITGNICFQNITEAWLRGDHYKWRAMRANGINETFITGDATDPDKFLKWAETVPHTMRNPLYHWTHLELQRYFDINTLLDQHSARTIYRDTSELLQTEACSTRAILRKMNVEVICTTDDPVDDLQFHKAFQMDSESFDLLPGFRPDKFLIVESEGFTDQIHKLEEVTSRDIRNLRDLVECLQMRIDFFHDAGCRLSDHGLTRIFAADFTDDEVDKILKKRLAQRQLYSAEVLQYKSAMLYYLARMYEARDWTMQFHLGALRNNNTRLIRSLGSDAGADSIGDFPQAADLSKFLNRLDSEEKLARTVLYNLNPRDNEVFATMAGNFQDGSIPGKIQWGSAWWFLDQKDGMEDQLNVLSNMGLLSRFIGMLTDSRSFLSFPRHEYFRRILCNLLGTDIENGLLPNDKNFIGSMVQDISYRNVKRYLGL